MKRYVTLLLMVLCASAYGQIRTNLAGPGVYGTLPVTKGGTGTSQTSLNGLRKYLGLESYDPFTDEGNLRLVAPTGDGILLLSDKAAAPGGGAVSVYDPTIVAPGERPITVINPNEIQMGLGTDYIYARMAGSSNGLFTVSSSNGFSGFMTPVDNDFYLSTPAENWIRVFTGSNYTDLTVNASNQLNSSGGFAGSGAGLTNVPDSALSSNVALQDGDNTFTGNNSFTGSLSFDGLAIASGKTLTVSKTMTLTSSDDTSVITLPAGTKTLASTDGSVAGLASGTSTFTYDANDGHWVTADVVKARSGLYAESNIETLGYFVGDGSLITGIVDSALSANVPLKNAANAYTNTASYQPGAAYDTATLGAEILDATTWTLGAGWTYASGTDWTQGFVHSGAITAVNATPTNGGTGYTLNDVLTVTTGDGTATVTATGVTDGVVTAVTLTSGGTTGYRGGTGQATSGGTGNGCTVNVTAIAGGTATLAHSDNASGGYKQVTVTITGRTAGWITVTYGLTTFPATTTSTAWGFYAGAGPLSIAPTTNFDGAVTVSVKAITPSAATFTIKDSSGTATLEGRSQTATLGNQYLGVSSGRYNTTGSYNTGYGNLSLSNVTSGVSNTAYGYRSLASLIYGSYNCAYGSSSGSFVTTGGNNSLFGQYSGADLTTGSNNSGFGARSLFGCVTGSYNVGIGTYTGNVATGSGNIFLGYSAGRYATGSNEFYVNNKDQVNTNQEKANSLLYGVMGATAAAQTLQVGGKLKVDPTNPVGGYTAPTEALDVVGNIKASGGVTANTFPLIQWRGSSASDPTENLSEGQMYWNTSGTLRIYTGSAWVIVGIGP